MDSEKFSSSARTWKWNTDTHCEYSCLFTDPPPPSVKKTAQWGTPTVAPPLLPPTLFYSHGSCSTDRGVRCWIRGTMQLIWLNLGAHAYAYLCVCVFFWEGGMGCEEMRSRPPTVANWELQEFLQPSHNSDIVDVYSGFRVLDELLSVIAICSKTLWLHLLSSLFHYIQVSIKLLSV